tara:strand:+ start:426 stop:647 length:222 start_codon:yes stop_codon:yes gene_type:complete
MRHFIFFYKNMDNTSHQYGNCGWHSEKLPRHSDVYAFATKDVRYTESQCNLLGYNEVTKEDYNSFFEKEESKT